MARWLRLCAPNAGGMGSTPWLVIKMPHAHILCGAAKKIKTRSETHSYKKRDTSDFSVGL